VAFFPFVQNNTFPLGFVFASPFVEAKGVDIMVEYSKIQTLFKRDTKGKIIEGLSLKLSI
jgi:hypothetical protein